MIDYYEILELDENCSKKDIKHNYKKLCLKYHPDKNNNVNCHSFIYVKDCYEILLNYKENENPDFLYPDLDDPKFSIKIAKKKEFYDHIYEDKMFDIKEQSELLCNADFELMPHQNFIKNFLSSYTPYNSLLLFHSVGTGKTCSAIGIAEETRNYYKYTNTSNQQIIIIASPNVQSNFKLQLFDPNKLQNNNGIWTLNTCVGNSLISEINPMNSKQLTKKQIIKQINNIISTNYNFMGYIGFSNFINRLININENSGYTKNKSKIFRFL